MTGAGNPGQYQQPVRSGAAIVALAVSILALLFNLIGGVVLPIILGLVAVGFAAWGLVLVSRKTHGGRGLAIWGLIIGLLSVAGGIGNLLAY
jgi:hypothetical protein